MKISILVFCVALLAAQGLQGAAALPKFYHQIIDADDAQGLAHWLDERGEDVNTLQYMMMPLLLTAARWGHINIVEFLIMRGVDVKVTNDGGNVWNHAAKASHNSEEIIKLLARQQVPGINIPASSVDARRTALINAVRENPDVVPLLLEYGADPSITDALNLTALDYASHYGRDKTTIHLLSEAMQQQTREKKE